MIQKVGPQELKNFWISFTVNHMCMELKISQDFKINACFDKVCASLMAQMVKNPPAMQETWVQSLGWEDPLEKEMATHSSILSWIIHKQRRLAGYSP